jgi:hypothetical protein
LSFHTFTPCGNLSTQVVVRHLHHSIPVEDIETTLMKLGFSVLCVRPIFNRFTRNSISLFSVSLESIESSHNIFKLIKLLNSIITIEKPRISRLPPQCMKCQSYGHTRAYCRPIPRCIKCSEIHLTADCTKFRELPVKCALYSGAHTENYKGLLTKNSLSSKI